MRPPMARLGAALCGLVGLAAGQIAYRAGVDVVSVGVTVIDRRGGLVGDLSERDFEILEDGRVQPVQFFARGDGDTRPPLHLGLMLDASGSMERDLALARSAAIRFLNRLPEAEDITLVDFDTEVRVTQYPQRDFARLVERIRRRRPDGWTALYDALGTYLDGAAEQAGRTVLVMYTDGGDTRSSLTLPEALTLLKASPVTVYAIGLLDNTGSARLDLRLTLQRMAEATGGQAFFPAGMKEVDAAYDRLVAEIQGQYHLGYVSGNARTDGAWRRVEVRVKRDGLRARARPGYFAPYRASPARE